MASSASRSLLIFFAVPEEARPFIRHWVRTTGGTACRIPHPGLASWRLGTMEVHVTGMGRNNAGRVGRSVLDALGEAGAVITSGFAGGLDPDLPCGQVLVDGDPGLLLAERLVQSGARRGRFHEATRVAVTPDDKARLRRETGVEAVEMESTTLRTLARERQIPSATVRVISDAAGDRLPLDFNALMTSGDRLDFKRLIWTVLRSPQSVPRLMAFQKTVRGAADELARVMVEALQKGS